MADRNQLKRAVQKDPENDPFAELTRIMGFDPRVPVVRQQPSAVEPASDELSIDLERELMGEFGSLEAEGEAAAEPQRPSLRAVESPPEAEAADSEDFADDYDFVFDEPTSEDTVDAAAQEAAHEALGAELDAAFGDSPAGAVVAATEQQSALQATVESFEAEPRPAEEVGEPEAWQPPRAAPAAELPDDLGFYPAMIVDDQIAFAEIPDDMLADEPVMRVAEPLPEDDGQEAEPESAAEELPVIPTGAERDLEAAEPVFAPLDAAFDAEVEEAVEEAVEETGDELEAAEPIAAYDLEGELRALLSRTRGGEVEPAAGEDDAEAGGDAYFDEELQPAAFAHSGGRDEGERWRASPDDDDDAAAYDAAQEGYEGPELDDGATVPDDWSPEDSWGGEAAPAEQPVAEEGWAAAAADTDPISDFVAEQEGQAAAEPTAPPSRPAAAASAPDPEPDMSDPFALDDAFEIEEEIVAAVEAEVEAAMAETPEAELATDVAFEPRAEAGPDAEGTVEAEAGTEPARAAVVDPFSVLATMMSDVKPFGETALEPRTDVATTPVEPIAVEAATSTAPEVVSDAPPAGSTEPAMSPHEEGPGSGSPTASESANVSESPYPSFTRSPAGHPAHAPDIETIDVPESAVALADDLDLPDVDLEEDIPLAADFDDFEAELANAFRQQASQPHQPVSPQPPARDAYQNEFAGYEHRADIVAPAVGAALAAGAAASAAYAQVEPATRAADAAFEPAAAGSRKEPEIDDDDLAYDPMISEDMAVPAPYAEPAEPRPARRRGLFVAAIVGGVAVAGGIAAYALTGGGDGGQPALVRADEDPVKVRPENPGGTTVPNQDNKVFQTMNGDESAASQATQERLISGTEEPVDVAARAEPPAPPAPQPSDEALGEGELEVTVADDPVAAEIAAAPKGEDRIAPAAEAEAVSANGELIAVAPRKVRTMVVRPDGSLVPNDPAPQAEAAAAPAPAPEAPEATPQAAASEEPAPAPEAAEQPAAATAATPEAAQPAAEETAALEPAPAPAPVAAPAEPAAPAPQAAEEPQAQAGTPDQGPVAPARPADQPVDVVGEVKPTQVAAAGGAAAAGAWSMQIASQPSEAAAQSTYDDLARRYAKVIGGKGVNIVKAEIAGKGTFWRVRVPAGSRSDAVSLCESYKSAGGNCFVSR